MFTDLKQFAIALTDAYEHIYDLVYLRTHPLSSYFSDSGNINSTKENAWQLHHTLLKAIQELDPGTQAPTFSREWRRYRLMMLRYVDGLTPQAIADQLAISRRHYYREHEGAIEAIADILWKQYSPKQNTPPAQNTTQESNTVVNRMELMRLEAAQLAQVDRRTRIAEVLSGVLALLYDKAKQQNVVIHNQVSQTTPEIWADHRLIRQLLLGLIGHLVKVTRNGKINISSQIDATTLVLSLAVQPDSELIGSIEADPQTPMSIFDELAALSGVSLLPLTHNDQIAGFTITIALYTGQHRSVLIVDDNDDIRELLQRYLKPHHYEVITLNSAQGLLETARKVQPTVIILDLMMPDQDGWDLLQLLQNHPETQAIPVIICSVLRQRELALSLGAAAFLEKPIDEARLLAMLSRF